MTKRQRKQIRQLEEIMSGYCVLPRSILDPKHIHLYKQELFLKIVSWFLGEENMNLWWGYKHTSGTYQAKRYLDDWGQAEMQDARDSDFCEQVVGPFEADGREEALAIVKELTS